MDVCDCYMILLSVLNALQITLQLPPLRAVFKETDSCECGRSGDAIATRIVGGEIVENYTYPWMTAIFLNGRMHCGGSLINDRYVLTAGHCLNGMKKDDLKVLLGVTNLQKVTPESKKGFSEVEIERMIVHEEFASDYLHDVEDVGLIKLKHPIKINNKIIPICLPSKDANVEAKMALVTGWGRTDQDGTSSRSLRKTNLKVMRNEDCRNITSVGEHITDSMICAYGSQTDACQGDSGGPLVVENNGTMEQIGIVSWGIGCAKPGIPGVYSRLTSYLGWISQHTHDAMYCKKK